MAINIKILLPLGHPPMTYDPKGLGQKQGAELSEQSIQGWQGGNSGSLRPKTKSKKEEEKEKENNVGQASPLKKLNII